MVGGREINRKRYTSEQIIRKLRESEAVLTAEAVEKGIRRTYFRAISVLFIHPKSYLTDYNL
jgi:hypothetical protein